MKKRWQKSIAMLCAGVMLTSSLAGCSSDKSAESAAKQEGTEQETKNGKVPAKEEALSPKEKIELTMWSPSTDADMFHNAYLTAIEEFEKEHPNITINMEVFENETYKKKIKSAAAGNELPDIFYSWQGGFSQSFAEAGKALDLDPYYETYKEDLPEAAVGNTKFVDDSVYGTAYNSLFSCIFYNKKMFKEHNLKTPETWEEFKEVCKTFVDAGIAPLTTSSKETWVLAILHDALGLKSAGNEKVVNILTGKGGSYDDPDFLYAAEQLKELVDMGAFVDGSTGISCAEAETLFESGVAPMMVHLSLYNPSANTGNTEDFDIIPFPVVNDNAAVTDVIGGASECLMAAADTKYPDQAGYAAFELSKKIADVGYADGAGVSPWLSTPKKESLTEIQKKKEDIIKATTSSVLWWNTVMQGDDATEYLSLLEQLFIGDITPEEFAAGMDAQLAQ